MSDAAAFFLLVGVVAVAILAFGAFALWILTK